MIARSIVSAIWLGVALCWTFLPAQPPKGVAALAALTAALYMAADAAERRRPNNVVSLREHVDRARALELVAGRDGEARPVTTPRQGGA